MTFPTIEDVPVLSMRLGMPLHGTWQAKVNSEAETLAGTVVIDDGEGQSFTGRVVRTGVVAGRNRALIVGGRGKLAEGTLKLAAKHFRAVNLQVVASEILNQAGETLSPTSHPNVLNQRLAFWSVMSDTPGTALSTLLQPFGAAWRTLADGSIWLGIDDFPEAPEQDRLELEPFDDDAMVKLAVDAFALRPGVTLDNRRVVQVQHRFDDEGRRTDYWYG